MKKVLVIGSAGMAGHVITTYFEEKNIFQTYNLSHRKKFNNQSCILDVTNFEAFNDYLNQNSFDVIINCIGVLNQFAETNKHKAILLNSYLPRYLEKKYKNISTKIIHLSTDCVFSGKTGKYIETSFKDGDTFYARTKALGEIDEGNCLTFRTSIIGPDCNYEGIGLFNWFMKSRGEIKGYVNAIWTGVTTIELAKAIEKGIEQNISGIYHLVPNNSISKYDLLRLFKKVFNREDINIIKDYGVDIDKSLINNRDDFQFSVSGYEPMINEMQGWIEKHKELYMHYF